MTHTGSGSLRRLAGVLALAVGALACGDDGRDAPRGEQVRTQLGEAVDEASKRMEKSRRALEARARTAIERTEGDLDDARRALDAGAEQSSDAIEQGVERVEEARQELDRGLEQLRTAGEQGWEEARRRVQRAIAELQRARREVSESLSGAGPEAG